MDKLGMENDKQNTEYDDKQTMENDDKQIKESDKLTINDDQLNMVKDKHTMESDKYTSNCDKLTMDEDKHTMKIDKPTTENDKPTTDNDKPTTDNSGSKFKVKEKETKKLKRKEKKTSYDLTVKADSESLDVERKRNKSKEKRREDHGAVSKTVQGKNLNLEGSELPTGYSDLTKTEHQKNGATVESDYIKTLEWMEASSKENFDIYSRTKRKLYDLHNIPHSVNYKKNKEKSHGLSNGEKTMEVNALDMHTTRRDEAVHSSSDEKDSEAKDPSDNSNKATLLQLANSVETRDKSAVKKTSFTDNKQVRIDVPLPTTPLQSLERSRSLPHGSLSTTRYTPRHVPPPPPILMQSPNQKGVIANSPLVRPKTKQTGNEDESPGPSNEDNAEEHSNNHDNVDLVVAQEVFRTMVRNVRPYISMSEAQLDPDRMQLDELQAAIMDLRYLEQAMFEADEFLDLDFDELGGFNFELPHFSERDLQPSFAQGVEVMTECLICYDEVKLHKRLCCEYPACDACMEQYIETSISEGIVKIPCIGNSTCDAFIYRDEILGRLSVPMKDKYYKFLVDANKDPKIKTCPRCSSITNVTDEQLQKKTKYGLLITCSECHLEWCFECQAPWHAGIKCKEFRKGDKLVKSWAKEKHYGTSNAQKCPKCKIFIERKGGCDHMVCLKCDTGFCYKCGGRYLDMKFFGNHLSRYSPLGCKYNYKPDKPVLRKLIRGSVFGAKLLGGVVLVGLGVAAVGVLLGASVVILPAFGAYKYRRHRKFKRRQKRQQELIKNRSKNAMMELHRERPTYMIDPRSLREWENLVREDAIRRSSRSVGTDTVHIGIQTGKSQQVDVTVHNPYQQDTLVANDDQQNSEIRMNITNDRGQVTVTTAEISHNNTAGDGSEAEIVLHVKTSYPKNEKESKSQVDEKSEATVNTDSNVENSDVSKVETEANVDANESKCLTNLASTQNPSEIRPMSAQVHRRAHSTGSVRRTLKKQDFGSISRKWRLKSLSGRKTSENDSTESSTQLSLDHPEGLNVLENNKPSVDADENSESENLTQSGCFLKLLGKKINTYQSQVEKEKQFTSKSDSNLGEKLNCPDVVSCALEAERKSKENLENVGQGQNSVKVVQNDTHTGFVSTETDTTAL